MKVTKTQTIMFREYSWLAPDDPEQFESWPVRLTEDNPFSHIGIPVGEHEVTFEVPDNFDPNPAKVVMLREELRRAGAEFEKRKTEILAKIQECLAIEGPRAGANIHGIGPDTDSAYTPQFLDDDEV